MVGDPVPKSRFEVYDTPKSVHQVREVAIISSVLEGDSLPRE